MPTGEKPKPTEAELQILAVLWRRGPSTVRQVHDDLGSRTGYTSVLKLMQIMAEKELVAHKPPADLTSTAPVRPRRKSSAASPPI